jgi:hypothetical protein
VTSLELVLYDGPVRRAPGDDLLALLPERERPLRGDAGRVDWRLGGELSRLLESGFATGAEEEAVLLPAGSRVGAARILVVGVGPGLPPSERAVERALRLGVGKLIGLRATSIRLALPGSIDPSARAESLLRGLVRGATLAPAEATLTAVIPGARGYEAAFGAVWDDALGWAAGLGVRLEASWREVRRGRAGAQAAAEREATAP